MLHDILRHPLVVLMDEGVYHTGMAHVMARDDATCAHQHHKPINSFLVITSIGIFPIAVATA